MKQQERGGLRPLQRILSWPSVSRVIFNEHTGVVYRLWDVGGQWRTDEKMSILLWLMCWGSCDCDGACFGGAVGFLFVVAAKPSGAVFFILSINHCNFPRKGNCRQHAKFQIFTMLDLRGIMIIRSIRLTTESLLYMFMFKNVYPVYLYCSWKFGEGLVVFFSCFMYRCWGQNT